MSENLYVLQNDFDQSFWWKMNIFFLCSMNPPSTVLVSFPFSRWTLTSKYVKTKNRFSNFLHFSNKDQSHLMKYLQSVTVNFIVYHTPLVDWVTAPSPQKSIYIYHITKPLWNTKWDRFSRHCTIWDWSVCVCWRTFWPQTELIIDIIMLQSHQRRVSSKSNPTVRPLAEKRD